MEQKKNDSYELVLEPDRGWFAIDWRSLWHYRDLLYFLVRREFISKYKQTILGPIWFIIQPLLTTVVFTVIFGNIAKIPTNHIPPILFYLCGLLPWAYFAQCLSSISSALISNAMIFEKVYFPRLIIPLSIIVSNAFMFLLQLAVFLGFYAYFKCLTPAGTLLDANRFIFWLPLLLLQTAAISLGVGLLVASMTVKYRDFQHLVGFSIQLWMYATPIIYPLSVIPRKWKLLFVLNPMSGIVEGYRYAFFGTGFVNADYMICSAIVTVLVLIAGILVFNKIERTFVDTI